MKQTDIDLQGATILVVDDEPASVDLMCRALEEEGYEILIATGGGEAIDLVKRGPAPDMMLLDVRMPGVDGFETCRRLKTDPDQDEFPILFVTGSGDTEALVEGFTAGGVDYLVKPVQKPSCWPV